VDGGEVQVKILAHCGTQCAGRATSARYSLESLRELALAPLDTERSRNGYFIDASIKTLFKLIYSGFAPQEQMTMAAASPGRAGRSLGHTFEMKPLKGDLFDDARTPTVRRVRLRNHMLQQVLESLGYPMGFNRTSSRWKHRTYPAAVRIKTISSSVTSLNEATRREG